MELIFILAYQRIQTIIGREIDDVELTEKIFDKADEMGISPDELVCHIIKEYAYRQCQGVVNMK